MLRSIETSFRHFSLPSSSSPRIHSKRSTSRSPENDLIEDWPHNVQQSVQIEGNHDEKSKLVRFSDFAACRIYPMIHPYESNKSYTKSDQKSFGRSMLVQAAMIKKTLASVDIRGSEDTMSHLLRIGINPEDIIGIEHLVLAMSPSDVAKQRQRHTRAILLEQEKQKIAGIRDAGRLGEISMFSSKQSVRQARIRGGILMDGQSSSSY
ncbi:hypothetical protein ACHAXS_002966 [Conticribra weissflogii]